MIRFEGKRCLKSKGSKIVLLLSLLIAGGHFLAFCVYFLMHQKGGVISSEDMLTLSKGISDINIYPACLYEGFIGGEGYTFFNQLYFYLVPLLAVIPYGGSFFSDCESGYLKNIYTRTTKSSYIHAKYFVTFFSGAIAAALPYVMSFVLNSLYVPMVRPYHEALHTNVINTMSMAEWYYTKPMLYFGVYLLAIMLCGGFWAVLAGCISFASRSILFVMSFPFLVSIATDYMLLGVGKEQYSLSRVINPMIGNVKAVMPIQNVFMELVICVGVSYAVFSVLGRKWERIW